MRPDSASTPATDETRVTDYVLQNMPAGAHREFEARLALEPALRRKVDDYRADLERLKATLPAARVAETSWAAVEAELRRHVALDGIDAADHPPGQQLMPAGSSESDS